MRPTAILIFARSAKEECYQKKVAHKYADNIQLFERLNEHIVTLVKKTGIPFEILNESQQIGETFGQCLANGIATNFEKGYEHIILLGNDCVQLQIANIMQAVTALEDKSLVIGPDYHGCVYLIGINKTIFDKQLFTTLNWQTKWLVQGLKNYHTAVAILPVLRDIDNIHSAHIVVALLPVTSFFYNLLASITVCCAYFHVITCIIYYKVHLPRQQALRAPPALM